MPRNGRRSQRLTRIIVKSKAMEMCLAGRMMDAPGAERALVSRVGPAANLVAEAVETAAEIAAMTSKRSHDKGGNQQIP
jgi:enoyl-CoA hydratase